MTRKKPAANPIQPRNNTTPSTQIPPTRTQNISTASSTRTPTPPIRPRNNTTPSTPTPPTQPRNATPHFKLSISPDILASKNQTRRIPSTPASSGRTLSQPSSQPLSQQTMSGIIRRYPNINIPRGYRPRHEEEVPRSDRASHESQEGGGMF